MADHKRKDTDGLPDLRNGTILRTIGIDNLRAIRMPEPVPLRRLMLIVGRNGIGKSTFARLFPLLRQSSGSRTREPLLWWERDQVDFGSFEEALRRNSKSMTFTFGFEDSDSTRWEAKTTLCAGPVGSRVSHVEIMERDSSLKLHFGENGAPRSIMASSNGKPLDLSGLLADKEVAATMSLQPWSLFGSSTRSLDFITLMGKQFEQFANSNFGTMVHRILWMASGIDGLDFPEYSSAFQGTSWSDPKGFKTLTKRFGASQKDIESFFGQDKHARNGDRVSKALFLWRALLRLRSAEHLVNQMATRSAYLGPFRAVPERLYRQQAVDVEQLDPRGANLALFLSALSERERLGLNQFLTAELGFEVHLQETSGQYSVNIRMDGGDRFNLLDVGFGYSQVLPVAVQLWASSRVLSTSRTRERLSTLVIEQPELHLHPHQQVLIARALAATASAEAGPVLVVETHSDHLVAEIGMLVARGRLPAARVGVLCIEPHEEAGAAVRLATYDSDGILINWPTGFLAP